MEELTLDRAVQLAREVIQEFSEDHLYHNDDINGWKTGDPCHYVHGGYDSELVPGCIVGHIFHRFGVPLEDMDGEYMDGYSAPQAIKALRLSVSEGASEFLHRIQNRQDTGWTWGRSIDHTLRDMGYDG